MKYKKIVILTILLISLLAVSAVNAADNVTDDVVDMQEAFSRPGKMTAVFGHGNTAEDAVDNLLLNAEKIGVDLRRCELAIFSMSGAGNRLSIYDVNEAPYLMAKKMGREIDSLTGDSLTLLSAPIDDSLGDKVKIFAVFCEGD